MVYQLRLELLSDTTFGRGDGVAGLVDQEVEHDPQTGLPFVRGRTLKGLLVEACAETLYSLELTRNGRLPDFQQAAQKLFGSGGSEIEAAAQMRVGKAVLDNEVRTAFKDYVTARSITAADALEAFTSVRRQTAMDERTDAPARGSLRASRVVLLGTVFFAPLEFDSTPDPLMLALLAACAAGVRRAGTGRNRGRGHIKVDLIGVDKDYLKEFASLVKKGNTP